MTAFEPIIWIYVGAFIFLNADMAAWRAAPIDARVRWWAVLPGGGFAAMVAGWRRGRRA